MLRLRAKWQFKNVFDSGRKLRCRPLLSGPGTRDLAVLPISPLAVFFVQNGVGHARLGIVVTKKNVSGAVRRNGYKRIIRESFRFNRQLLPAVDLIVFIYAATNNIKKGELRLCLEKQWRQLMNCAVN